jgi:hypothetical protein
MIAVTPVLMESPAMTVACAHTGHIGDGVVRLCGKSPTTTLHRGARTLHLRPSTPCAPSAAGRRASAPAMRNTWREARGERCDGA